MTKKDEWVDPDDDEMPAGTHALTAEEMRAASGKAALPFAVDDEPQMPGTLTLSSAEQSSLAASKPVIPFTGGLPSSSRGPDSPVQDSPVARAPSRVSATPPWLQAQRTAAPTADEDVTHTIDLTVQPTAPALHITARAARAAPQRLAIDRYAAIKASLWRGIDPSTVLTQAGLDETGWVLAEDALADALQREAEAGESEIALEVAIALERATAGS